MSPVAFAIVFIIFTLGAVAAYVLLIRQSGRYEAQKADLRYLLNQAAARRDEAEAQIREMAGGGDWEQEEFWAIAAELSSDEGGAS